MGAAAQDERMGRRRLCNRLPRARENPGSYCPDIAVGWVSPDFAVAAETGLPSWFPPGCPVAR